MAEKQKSAKKPRGHKESKRQNGGGGKVRLTPVEKVLIANGGVGHRYLRKTKGGSVTRPKRSLSASG